MIYFKLIFLFLGIERCYSSSLRGVSQATVEEEADNLFQKHGRDSLNTVTGDKEERVIKNRSTTGSSSSTHHRFTAAAPTFAPTKLECYSWCKLDKNPWRSDKISKCNWPKCGACPQCDLGPKECASWCKWNDEYQWHGKGVAKCKWRSCGACDQCKPHCAYWCENNATPWRSSGASKCTWSQCSACEQCDEASGSSSIHWACPDNISNIDTFFDMRGTDKPKWDCSCCPSDYYGWWLPNSSDGGCCKRINY